MGNYAESNAKPRKSRVQVARSSPKPGDTDISSSATLAFHIFLYREQANGKNRNFIQWAESKRALTECLIAEHRRNRAVVVLEAAGAVTPGEGNGVLQTYHRTTSDTSGSSGGDDGDGEMLKEYPDEQLRRMRHYRTQLKTLVHQYIKSNRRRHKNKLEEVRSCGT